MVQIFAIKSGTTTYKYGGTVAMPGGTGVTFYDPKQVVKLSTIENKYNGTISYSGYVSTQNFG